MGGERFAKDRLEEIGEIPQSTTGNAFSTLRCHGCGMKDSKREMIKLSANYINGVAISFLIVGGLSQLFVYAKDGDIWQAIKMMAVALASSLFLHSIGLYVIGLLDKDE
ncbi:hypothetical protein [Phyllobacterium pellucidum]|uniref:hypothetical protein n=1 Tax=Phyllobacterium pellucidum TaxID=2740464 RepID=UPI001D13B116|nr:hypothetical protein [Phyllobacterium sp. T1018]UGY08535.1 hypothetical protein LLE51_010805 [Phyllobacterium sp. T1018]